MRLQFKGHVDSRGVLHMDDVAKVKSAVKELAGKIVVMTVEPHRQARSLSQNAWYWACIVPAIAQQLSMMAGHEIDPETAHDVLKSAFIGTEDTPLGKAPKSSKALDIEQFSDYCEKIRAYAATEYGMFIPGPNEA